MLAAARRCECRCGYRPMTRSRRVSSFVTPARFERATYGLGNRCSIHLSYGAWTRRLDVARRDLAWRRRRMEGRGALQDAWHVARSPLLAEASHEHLASLAH